MQPTYKDTTKCTPAPRPCMLPQHMCAHSKHRTRQTTEAAAIATREGSLRNMMSSSAMIQGIVEIFMICSGKCDSQPSVLIVVSCSERVLVRASCAPGDVCVALYDSHAVRVPGCVRAQIYMRCMHLCAYGMLHHHPNTCLCKAHAIELQRQI